jgi:hypothetical protein
MLGEPLACQFLVGADVVAPGADDRHVRTLDRVHAVVRAARELELELVRQRGAVDVVDEGVDHLAVGARFVVAALFAARRADAAHRGPHRRPGAAEVEAEFVQGVEGVLDLVGLGALEHDVARLAVEGDQARAMLLPDVGHLAQHVGGVVHAGRWLHAQGVELGRIRKHRHALLVLQLGEARDHAAAVAEHTDRAALPVPLLCAVGRLQLTHQVDHVVLVVSQTLQPGDETRPGPALELVEHGCRMGLLCHGAVSPSRCQGVARRVRADRREWWPHNPAGAITRVGCRR